MRKKIAMLVHMRWGIVLLAGGVLGVGTLVFSWTGPSASPPNGNVPAPVNVGSSQQTKSGDLLIDAAFGTNALAVFGNSLLQTSSYLNWGSVSGDGGYGIRDASGVLKFKNLGGTWQSIQEIVSGLLGGGAGSWSVSGNNIYNNNSGSVGIGTASPTAKLTVIGGADFTTTAPVINLLGSGGAYYGAYNLSGPGSGNTWGIQYLSGGNFAIGYYPSGAHAIQITQGNNVGIGTNPTDKLDVAGNVKATGFCIGASCITSWPGGAGFTGSGSTNYIPKFTGATALGNSIISDNGSTVTVAGNLTVTGSDLYMGSTDVIRRDGANAYLFPWGSGYSGNTVFLGGGANTNLWVTGDAYVAARGLNVSQLASKVGGQFWQAGGDLTIGATCPSGSLMAGYKYVVIGQTCGEGGECSVHYAPYALCQWI